MAGMDEIIKRYEDSINSVDDRCPKCGCLMSHTPIDNSGDRVITHCSNDECSESKKGKEHGY